MTIKIRQLGHNLKDLRQKAGLTQQQVADELRCSKGRVIYIEQGKGVRPTPEFVNALLDLYGVTKAEPRHAIQDLVIQGREKNLLSAYKDLFPVKFPTYESAAASIRTYEVLLIPGLLQTAAYATAIERASTQPQPADAIERRVEARQARQQVLNRTPKPPRFWAVIEEAALLRRVGGPEVMQGQIRHLMDAAKEPGVTIQVLPATAGAHATMASGFVILDYDDQVPLVYLEGALSSLFMDESEEIEAYNLLFGQVSAMALTPEESIAHLGNLHDQLQR